MLRIPWIARRTNESIIEQLGIQNEERLLHRINKGRMKFFGHVIRRDSLEKQILQAKVDGKRPRGRPPLRYADQIAALARLTVYETNQLAQNREEWRIVLE